MAEKSNEELVQRLRDICTSNAGLRQPDIVAERDAATAVLARMAGPGEVVVPTVLTETMMQAAYKARLEDFPNAPYGWIGVRYAAMLAAPNQGGNDDKAG